MNASDAPGAPGPDVLNVAALPPQAGTEPDAAASDGASKGDDPADGSIGTILSTVTITRGALTLELEPGARLLSGDRIAPASGGSVVLDTGTRVDFGADIDTTDLLNALANGTGWDAAIDTLLSRAGQLALQFGAGSTAQAEAAFVAALLDAVNAGVSLDAAVLVAENAYWRHIELAAQEETAENDAGQFLNALASGEGLDEVLARVEDTHDIDLSDANSLEALLEFALQADKAPRVALLEALQNAKTIFDLQITAAANENISLINALASGQNVEAIVGKSGADDIASFELSLSRALSSGTSVDDAVASASILAKLVSTAIAEAESNPLAKLVTALASGADVSEVMEAAASGDTKAFEEALSQALSTGSPASLAVASAAVSGARTATANEAAASNPVAKLIGALASGADVTEIIEAAASGDSAAFEQALSQALSTGTGATEAVASAGETSGKTEAANAAAANSPEAQLVAALASGQNVSEAMGEAGGGDGAAFEKALSEALGSGKPAGQAVATASEASSKTAEFAAAAADNPDAQLAAGTVVGQPGQGAPDPVATAAGETTDTDTDSGETVASADPPPDQNGATPPEQTAATPAETPTEPGIDQTGDAGTNADVPPAQPASGESGGETPAQQNNGAADPPATQNAPPAETNVAQQTNSGSGATPPDEIDPTPTSGTETQSGGTTPPSGTQSGSSSGTQTQSPPPPPTSTVSYTLPPTNYSTNNPYSGTSSTPTSYISPTGSSTSGSGSGGYTSPLSAPSSKTASDPPPVPQNAAPVHTVPGTLAGNEDTALVITGISVSDRDAGNGTMRTSLSVTNGVLTFANAAGVTGNGTASVTIAGSQAAINAALSGGNLSYTPNANFNGQAVLTIVTNDNGNTGAGNALEDTDNVVLQIAGVNDDPVISGGDTTGQITEANPGSGSLTATGALAFTDVDSATSFSVQSVTALTAGALGTLQAVIGTQPAAGATGAIDWTYQIDPALVDYLAAGETLAESFEITLSDGNGGTHEQTVSVTVTGTNDAATLSTGAVTLTEADDAAALSTSGQLAISDPDSAETFVAQAGTAGTYGTFTVDVSGAWTYTASSAHDALAAGATYTDNFTVTSADGTATTVTLTFEGTNDAAILSTGAVTVIEADDAAALSTSGQLTISDPDSAETFVALAGTVGTYGTFTVDAAGAWTYTASGAHDAFELGQSYSDSFSVTSADGTTTNVTLTLVGTNDAPVLSSAQSALASATEDTAYTLTKAVLLENATDSENDDLSVANLSVSAGGIAASGEDFVFTPPADFSGTVTLSYEIVDGNGGSLPVTRDLTIDPVTDTPSLSLSNASGNEDSSGIALSISAQVTDLVGASETITGITITGVANGVLSAGNNQGGGSWSLTSAQLSGLSFIPDADYNGTVTLSVTATARDGNATSADSTTGTLTVTVVSVPDAPTGTDKTISLAEDGSHVFSASDFGFSDPKDSPADSFAGVLVTSLPGAGTLTNDGNAVSAGQVISAADIADGKLVFTPAADGNGNAYASFTFQVQDDGTLIEQAQFLDKDLVQGWMASSGGGWGTLVQAPAAATNQTAIAYALNFGGPGASIATDSAQQPDAVASAGASYHLAFDFLGLVGLGAAPVNVTIYAGNTSIGSTSYALANASPASEPVTLDTAAVPVGEDGQPLRVVWTAGGGHAQMIAIDNVVLTQIGGSGDNLLINGDFGSGSYYAGAITDQTPNTITFDVTPVNDAPQTSAVSGSGDEGAASISVVLAGGDVDGTVTGFWIVSLPGNGMLYADAALTTTLSADDIVAATGNAATVYFVADADFSGTPAFTFAAIDDASVEDASPATATITVSAVNDAPVISGQSDGVALANSPILNTPNAPQIGGFSSSYGGLPSGQSDGRAISGFEAGDTVSFTVTGANFVFTLYDGANNVIGPGTLYSEVMPGGGFQFTYTVTGGDDTTLRWHLGGNPHTGGNPSYSVLATASSPLATINEDTGGALTGIEITDIDASTNNLVVTLAVENGTLTLLTNVAGGLTAGQIANNGTGTVTVTAPQSAINATLAAAGGLIYLGVTDFNGTDTLTVTANDQGSTGRDPGTPAQNTDPGTGTASDEETVARYSITVAPVNDAPMVAPTPTGDFVITTGPPLSETAYSVIVQADGKIVAGVTWAGNFQLLRYNADGTPDDSFGTNGVANVDVATYDQLRGVFVQSTGDYVVVGSSVSGHWAASLARFGADGILDTDFGNASSNSGGTVYANNGGKITAYFNNTDNGFQAAALQSDDKIVVAGYFNASPNDIIVVRFTADGAIDTSFGSGGKYNVSLGTVTESVTAIDMAPDGSGDILLAGYANNDFFLMRLTSAGAPDNGFGTNGVVYTDFGSTVDRPSSMTVMPDGGSYKILVAGTYNDGNDFALARYNADGSLDTSFDIDGKLITDLGSSYDLATSVVVDTDGNILVSGRSNGDFVVVRYLSDGQRDTDFASNGVFTHDLGSTDETAYDLALDANGRIVVVGTTFNGTDSDAVLLRLNHDGTIDNGIETYSEDGPALVVDAGIVLSDPDSTEFSGATIQITGNFEANTDILAFTDQNGLTGVYDAATGILTLSGSASNTDYQTALRSITFSSTSEDPSELDRTVSFTVTDGVLASAAGTRLISVASVNDAPVALADAALQPVSLAAAGFETPNIGGHVYGSSVPAGAWLFSGQSGLSDNGSGFTSGNPGAPEGSQVAFLQHSSGNSGTISQDFTASAGAYVLEFDAARRANSNDLPKFQVVVDGVVQAIVETPNTSYTHHTVAVQITSDGPHTLSLVSLRGNDADETTLLDNISLTGANTNFAGSVATNDSDADAGAVLTYALIAPVPGLTLNTDGTYSVDHGDQAYAYLAEGKELVVVADYTVTDDHGASDQSTLTFTVTGVNNAQAIAIMATDCVFDPIVLNLDGDGVDLSATTPFDLDADGEAETIGWTGPGEGLLAIDDNGNGMIDDGSELTSDVFRHQDYVDSVAALKSLDSNGDGMLNAGDDDFASLQVWRDANSNGVSDAGELMSLADLGITGFALDTEPADILIDGQQVIATGEFRRDDGTRGDYVAVGFMTVDAAEHTPPTDDTEPPATDYFGTLNSDGLEVA